MLSDEERRKRQRIAGRAWRLAHPENAKAQQKKYYQAHKAARASYGKTYRNTHKAEVFARQKAYWLANPERERARQRASYKRHKAEQCAQVKAYRLTERGKLSVWLRRTRRRLLIKDMPTATCDELAKIKARQKGRCFYCHRRAELTLDHVIPLSKNGSSTAENLVFACKSCNSSKGGRLWRIC